MCTPFGEDFFLFHEAADKSTGLLAEVGQIVKGGFLTRAGKLQEGCAEAACGLAGAIYGVVGVAYGPAGYMAPKVHLVPLLLSPKCVA